MCRIIWGISCKWRFMYNCLLDSKNKSLSVLFNTDNSTAIGWLQSCANHPPLSLYKGCLVPGYLRTRKLAWVGGRPTCICQSKFKHALRFIFVPRLMMSGKSVPLLPCTVLVEWFLEGLPRVLCYSMSQYLWCHESGCPAWGGSGDEDVVLSPQRWVCRAHKRFWD